MEKFAVGGQVRVSKKRPREFDYLGDLNTHGPLKRIQNNAIGHNQIKGNAYPYPSTIAREDDFA